jgi:hypothetical protein
LPMLRGRTKWKGLYNYSQKVKKFWWRLLGKDKGGDVKRGDLVNEMYGFDTSIIRFVIARGI